MNMETLLEVKGLKKYFYLKGGGRGKTGVIKAVDDVSFSVLQGETLGLVGESGCGKTTLGRTLLRLTSVTAGEIIYRGKHIENLDNRELLPIRREMQIVFQDPFASLNPQLTIGNALAEPLLVHGLAKGKAEVRERVDYLLELVGLSPLHKNRYPHEFSGGQRQRIVLARALSLEPRLIVCDEPVSALDVSIQAQIINLLQDLQEELGLTYIFIAHDLNVVKHISDRIAVMYLGKIVELADKKALYHNPLHPYTRALLSAIPVPDPGQKKKRIVLKGEVPSPVNPPAGCRFRARCAMAFDRCRVETPQLKEAEPGHAVACHLVQENYA